MARELPELVTNPRCYDDPHGAPLHIKTNRYRHHDHIVRVTAQPRFLHGFRRVWKDCYERRNPVRMYVASSYRSCAHQADVCRDICGNSGGCPGLCAPPGSSMHNIGNAVDAGPVKPRYADELRRIFQKHDFHNFSGVNGSDPWHWSFRVTG